MRIPMALLAALALLTSACADGSRAALAAGITPSAVLPSTTSAPLAAETGPTGAPTEAPTEIQGISATVVDPDLRVGAVFLGSETVHSCSGAVLDSTGGDLILTAAHCLADGADAYFVPGYTGDLLPDDMWHIDAVYLDPRWLEDQNPLADFAIARVSRSGAGSVESALGSGLALGQAPVPGSEVAITGYEWGIGGGPVGCHTATTAPERGFPSLPCSGMSDGTSGSPWVSGSTVLGLTGGLDGGGCEDAISYSPPFDGSIAALLQRAEQGGPGDDPPAAYGTDC